MISTRHQPRCLFSERSRWREANLSCSRTRTWAHIRALHFRGNRDVFEEAVGLGANPDPIPRAVGADILAQLGVRKGASVADYPSADESAPILVALLADREPQVTASALCALGHLGMGESAHLARLRAMRRTTSVALLRTPLAAVTDHTSVDTLMALSADQDDDTETGRHSHLVPFRKRTRRPFAMPLQRG